MSLEKTAVLILAAVITILLGVAIWMARTKTDATGTDDRKATVAGRPDDKEKRDPRVILPHELQEEARKEREKKPNFDTARRGGYSTAALHKKVTDAKAKDTGMPTDDGFEWIDVKVEKRETYAKIAKRVLGNAALWGRVKEANGNIEDTKLREGMTFKMKVAKKSRGKDIVAKQNGPTKESPKTPAADPKAKSADSKYVDYVVKKNDNYTKIAKTVLGDGALHGEIRRAAGGLDERKLKIGAKIRIPVADAAKPSGSTAKKGAEIVADSR